MNKLKYKQTIIILAGLSAILITLLVNAYVTSVPLEKYSSLDKKYNNTSKELEGSRVRIQELKAMDVIEYAPNLSEVEEIIKNDKGDEREYVDDVFNCVDFSNELVKTFREERIYSCTVEVVFTNSSHLLVTLNTSDKGIVYIEPQNDKVIYNLSVGDDYCEKAGWEGCIWKISYIKSCL